MLLGEHPTHREWRAMPPQIFEPDGPRSRADVDAAVEFGAVDFVRPQMMTVTAIMAGLLPIMWGTGTGSQVMKRIAAPMVGGMVSSTILTLLVIPVIYALWRGWGLRAGPDDQAE